VLKHEGPYGLIECHLARANPHCTELGEVGEALMIFQGAEGYITPNWYASKAQTGKVVPTWNYAVVHAYGRVEAMDDAEWLRRHVSELTAQQEKDESKPWAVTDAPETFVDAMLRGIVGFRFRHHSSRRQMEDESEPRSAGPRWRSKWSQRAPPWRRPGNCRLCREPDQAA
jgi:transcriptional regulator